MLPEPGDWAALETLIELPAEPFTGHRWALEGVPDRVHGTAVIHDAQLHCIDCPPECPTLALGPLSMHDGRYRPSSRLPEVDQRLEITLSPRDSRLQVTRIIDTPLRGATPVYWPQDWSLTLTDQERPLTAVRRGDIAWLPLGDKLILAGGGPVPPGHTLTDTEVTLYVADLIRDVPAARTRLNVLPSPFHMELPAGQSVAGIDLLVSGVRFPETVSRDGIRILSNEVPQAALLEQLLALRVPLGLPRPLWVVAGPRDAYIGQRLVLSPKAHADPLALRQALLQTRPLEPSLRAALASRLGTLPPPVDPGCYGLRSRPELDRGRLIAQLELHGPLKPTSWQSLATQPTAAQWLAAPKLPRVRLTTTNGVYSLVDDASTGLPLLIPIQVGDQRQVVRLGQVIDATSGTVVIIDPDDNQPFHRE